MARGKKDEATFKGKGEATIENVDTGEKSKVEFQGEATVTSLEEKREASGAEHNCPECGDEQTRYGNKWVCTNVAACSLAQAQASAGGAREVTKAVAPTPPRAVNQRGRVD